MNEQLDFQIHSNNKIAIRDKFNDIIDLNESKWNFIFNSIPENWLGYFYGWRLDFIHKEEIKENLPRLVFEMSEKLIIDMDDHSKIFFQLKTKDRKLFNTIWQYYEYPSLIFLENNSDENKVLEKFINNSQDLNVANDFCIIYKLDPEIDVLWINKSKNILFVIDDNTNW